MVVIKQFFVRIKSQELVVTFFEMTIMGFDCKLLIKFQVFRRRTNFSL